MGSILHWITCTLLKRCEAHARSAAMTARTWDLIAENDEAWRPVREAIARDAATRPDLARALREARARHGG